MNIDDFFKLNDDLDLDNYGIIIKKNSIFSIKDTFNTTDKDQPTTVAININGLMGDFNLPEQALNLALLDNRIEKITSLFEIGDCVIFNGNTHVIQNKKYNDFINIWFYKISAVIMWQYESVLNRCN